VPLLRWTRLVVLGIPLLVALTLATTAPVVLMLGLVQPGYRVAGALCALPLTLGLVWSTALARTAVTALSTEMPVPATPEEVAGVAAAARVAGFAPPTVLVPVGGVARPISLRGLRRWFVLASPTQLADPVGLVAAVAADRRRGDDRLLLGAVAVVLAHAGWANALRLVTTSVRPGRLSLLDRLPGLVTLPLVLLVVPAWVCSWLGVQVMLLVAPRVVTDALLDAADARTVVRRRAAQEVVELGPGVRLGQMLVNARIERSRDPGRSDARTWWNTPRALAQHVDDGLIESVVRVTAATVLVGMGTFVGLGRLPAERIAWPWEQAAVGATVTAVDVTGADNGSLMNRLGVDIGAEYQATVRTEDGRQLRLREGSGEVAPGDRVTVVPATASDTESTGQGRALNQDSTREIVIIGLLYVAAGAGVQRLAGGIIGLVVARRLAQLDHDQRVATGRRHRARRPRDVMGMDLFR
jgi:hypothetical protein